MVKRRLPFFLILFILVAAGCVAHVSKEEIASMQEMNRGWQAEVIELKAGADKASAAFLSYRLAWDDTSNLQSKAALTDSLFMAKVQKTEGRYEDWFGQCMACVHSLEQEVADHGVWLEGLLKEPGHLETVRQNWDSRRGRFYQSLQRCRELSAQSGAYYLEIEQIKRRIALP